MPASAAPVSSKGAPIRTALPAIATAEPKRPSGFARGFRKVWRSAPVDAWNRCAAPALAATVSSKGAPTRIIVSLAATAEPKRSPSRGCGAWSVWSSAPVEVRRADQEVGADGGDRGAELVARGGRRLEERGQERARRRVEEVGGAGVAGGGVVEARADEQVAAGERHGGAEEVVLGGRGVEECGRPSGARQEHEDEEAGQRPDPASVARRSGPGRCGTRRLPIPGGATGVPGRVGVAARRRPGAQRSPIRSVAPAGPA